MFVASETHETYLLGVWSEPTGFRFVVIDKYLDTVRKSSHLFSTQEEALACGRHMIEADRRWKAGFESYERGEALPVDAHPDFAAGWQDSKRCDEPAIAA